MIEITSGDLFSSGADLLVNPVNLNGVMGKGLALEFKKRFPNMFNTYKEICHKHLFLAGDLLLIEDNNQKILLFPTKVN